MLCLTQLSALAFFVFLAAPAQAQEDVCALLDGAVILNEDDEYIGKVSSPFDSDSIFNKFGSYGNQFSAKSIWNQFGKNGGQFSSGSPFNKFSSRPPRLIKGRQVVALLSVSRSLPGAINPYVLGATCYDFDPQR